jgi:hypothetical protein
LIERLSLVKPDRIYLVADGPRKDRPDDAAGVEATRRLFDDLPWKCKVTRNVSDTNLGCARRVASGLSWVFEQVNEAIILEDDCLPQPSFFPYCEELLERYRDDGRVGSICGHDYTMGFKPPQESYYFSRYNLFWGWATWRRAWQHYDHAMRPIEDGTLETVLRSVFPGIRARLYWRIKLRKTRSGKINSWGYRWLLSCWRVGMLGVFPAANLISNIGFGTESTHTKDDTYGLKPARDLQLPLRHPLKVERDEVRDQPVEDRIFSRSFSRRLLWIARFIRFRVAPPR